MCGHNRARDPIMGRDSHAVTLRFAERCICRNNGDRCIAARVGRGELVTLEKPMALGTGSHAQAAKLAVDLEWCGPEMCPLWDGNGANRICCDQRAHGEGATWPFDHHTG